MMYRLSAGLVILALAACSPATQKGAAASGESPASSMTAAEAASLMASSMTQMSDAAQADAYVGQWTGPEGTALTITPSGKKTTDGADNGYDVVIRNLDGPRSFTGRMRADGLHFERDGKALVIHPGDGEATGMKWLADKHNCLVVDDHEGYCRD